MTVYFYLKEKPSLKKKKFSWLPVIFLLIGMVVLANASLPLALYQFRSQNNFPKKFLSPIGVGKNQVLGMENGLDYDQPENWFPTAPKPISWPNKITYYNISIPKLKIEDAVVEIGGENLSKSLVQYPATALPGEYGNSVIFGHSSLPQFFSPKDYRSIFSTLPKLKNRDKILVDFDGIQYQYQVIQMIEVQPVDTSVLAQYYDSQYLTLVTCVPPGTLNRRLVVRAQLE